MATWQHAKCTKCVACDFPLIEKPSQHAEDWSCGWFLDVIALWPGICQYMSMFRLHWHLRPAFWPHQVRFDSLLSFVVLEKNLHEISFIWEYNSVFPRSPNWHKSSKDHWQLISFPQAPFSPYIIQILMILHQSKYCYTHHSILIIVMVVKPCQAHVYYTPCFCRTPRPTQHAHVWLRPVCP